jgi:rhodanese-related sulfurtransferase
MSASNPIAFGSPIRRRLVNLQWLLQQVPLVCYAVLAAGLQPVQSQDQQSRSIQVLASSHVIGAECGTYSLVAAARTAGIVLDPVAIIDGNAVTGHHGSSAIDLINVARSSGIVATPVSGIGLDYLRNSHFPIVLHFNDTVTELGSGHWVAYLGEENGKAIVFDIMDSKRLSSRPFSELLMMMTGYGLIVSPRTLNVSDVLPGRFAAVLRCWPLAIILLLASLSRKTWQSAQAQAGLLLIASTVWALLWMNTAETGWRSNFQTVAWLNSGHSAIYSSPTSSEILSSRKMYDEIMAGNISLVDARNKEQFDRFHLPNAIYLGIDMLPHRFFEAASDLPTDKPVVVYCNNPQCSWSKIVAARLTLAGYTNVSCFIGGVQEYRAEPKRREAG